MKITRDLEKDQYIEWDFYDWLSENGFAHKEMRLEKALSQHYFLLSEEMSLSEFCERNPVFGMAKPCDTILEVNGRFYLIPAEMIDDDSEETVDAFEELAERILRNA